VIDRSQTRDTPWDPAVLDIASMFGTRVAEPILAGGHVNRHQTGHMIASDPIRCCQALASRGPSTYGSRLYGRDDTECVHAFPASGDRICDYLKYRKSGGAWPFLAGIR